MAWLNKALYPMRKAIVEVTTRLRSRKSGGGLVKLHNEVQTCDYEDIQVMWEMLQKAETLVLPKRRRHVWRLRLSVSLKRGGGGSRAKQKDQRSISQGNLVKSVPSPHFLCVMK
ncbi:hypothetical protein SUGI_0478400 [Cryptomeria japonica]|nr:hypothetical protein SUGI_0478400 [Cryptomeria japonica]